MKKLEGKTAFITGAAMGLGEGIAHVYAKHGAQLMIVDINPKVEEVAKEISKTYDVKVETQIVDVTDVDSCKAAAKEAVSRFGQIDVLAAIAGVCKLGDFLEMSDDDLNFHIDVNIKGVWNTTKAVLPYMLENGGGNIVVMSSVTGDIVADPGEVAYALSKAALIGFTKSLAVEYAAKNIRVNAMQLGYARTPMAESIARTSNPDDPESVLTEMATAIPMRRLGLPKEVGELAAFLGSDESSYMTGGQYVIDGGSTLPESVSVGIE
ncbi:SDR family oxidoreductase UcpA [Oceanobacillus jeddahense]|uniref:SDR family oxidoreductase UcpA n=1 Tax=Oceanobacillus jeddahense TaxID=1462527 RepID=UPI000595877F|nr:SDR family oxidoreductase UcpA [Oceanobacillus jeddahense]